MKQKLVRLITVFLVLGLLFSLVAGCTKNNERENKKEASQSQQTAIGEKTQSEPEEQTSNEPVPIRIFRPANIVNPEIDPIMQEIQKRTNTKVEIVTAPWDQCWNKLNLIMSSGENIDIINADQASSPWQKWAQEGLMYDLDQYVTKEKYPYIYSVINSQIFKPVKVNGKSYFIAGTHHGQDWGLFIREDWLEKVGLKMPTTMEELYDVMIAFRDKDPDGNNKADTIAYQATMTDVDNFGDFDPIFHGFGGSQGGFFKDLVVRDGKVTGLDTTENTREALKFINKMYREGLVNKDFPQLKDVVNANAKYLYANKAGIIWTSRAREFEEGIRKTDPNAKLTFVEPVSAKGYQFIGTQGTAWWLVVGVPKVSKNPEKALEFIEFCNSLEGRKLLVAGIEGRHYTELKDGVYKQDKAAWEKDFDVKANGYDYPLWWGFFTTVHGYIPAEKYNTFEEAMDNVEVWVSEEDSQQKFNWRTMVEYGAKYNDPNPLHSIILPETVDTYNKIQKNVKAVYFMKIITAKNEAEIDKLWDEYISEWKKAGGEDFIKAYQEYYEKNIK